MDKYRAGVGAILFLVGLLLIHYLRIINLSFMNLIILLLLFLSALVFREKLGKSILNKLSLFMGVSDILNEVSDIEKSDEYLVSQRFHKLMKQFDEYHAVFRELTKLRTFLKKEEFSQAEELYSLMNEKKEVIKNYNKNFIRKRLKTHKSFFDGKDDSLERSLDKQQRLAIVKDDKHNLVIAGAGSGKTAVIAARIAYLLRRKDRIEPKRILALAFNRKAAKEVHKRLKSDYNIDSVKVRTFHSFGLSIINENLTERPRVLDESESERRIRNIFLKRIKNKRLRNLLLEYFSRYLDEELDEASFSEKEEYYYYMRNKQYTTLSAERVKSVSERDIANFLFKNNIKFVYEAVARWADKGDSYGPYMPDFYLPDYDIYIEHWGVDEKGNIPPWFEMSKKRYHEKIKWAREQFSKHEKVLIETFEYQTRGGQLETVLKDKLIDHSVSMKELSYEELVERVYGFKETCKRVSEMFSTFIKLAKSNHISPDKLRSRISKLPDTKKKVFAKMGLSIYKAYQNSLKKNKEIDFEDMINIAITLAKEKREKYKNRYDHVLVDEFQDVSNQRFELIKTLVSDDNNTKLFCVGDDWQSIYAFAGSEVRFFIEFEDHFSYPEKTFLEWNYRCSKTIVAASNQLISNNKERVDKIVKAFSDNERAIILCEFQLYLKWQEYKKEQYEHAFCIINELVNNSVPIEDIMVISRFKFEDTIFDNLQIKCTNNGYGSVRFNTAHSCKGQEAKYVIILDVTSGTYGFPSEIVDSSVFDIVKSESAMTENKLDAERRLFYVALTRSKEGVYIYTQKSRESVFLNEIKDYLSEPVIPELQFDES